MASAAQKNQIFQVVLSFISAILLAVAIGAYRQLDSRDDAHDLALRELSFEFSQKIEKIRGDIATNALEISARGERVQNIPQIKAQLSDLNARISRMEVMMQNLLDEVKAQRIPRLHPTPPTRSAPMTPWADNRAYERVYPCVSFMA